jgi:hypothetical protein
MNCQTAQHDIDTSVGVVWSDDVDLSATTPLWASVRLIALDPSMSYLHRSTAGGSFVIEVSATPPPPYRTHLRVGDPGRTGPHDTGRARDAQGDRDRGAAME